MLVYHRVPFFAQAQSHLHLPRDRSMRARCGHPTDCAVTPGHPKQQNSLDIISYLFIAFYSHALSIQKFHEILYLSISIAQSMSEFIQSPPLPVLRTMESCDSAGSIIQVLPDLLRVLQQVVRSPQRQRLLSRGGHVWIQRQTLVDSVDSVGEKRPKGWDHLRLKMIFPLQFKRRD